MKARYQKPIIRNLGDGIPEVKGVCKSGGIAYPLEGQNVNCNSGGVAHSAGACNAGGTASGNCGLGSTPHYTGGCGGGQTPT